MFENFTSSELIAYGITGAGGIWLGFKKLLAFSSDANMQIARSDSQEDVIQILREQATSFADSNKELQEEVSRLRNANTDLTIELKLIKAENAALRTEVTKLSDEIAQLRELIKHIKPE